MASAHRLPNGVATIGDVARRAGVSPATVSRVLNGTSVVSADKAARVHDTVAALAYRPFGPARALRQHRVRVWAVIIADIENPFFTSVVRGIEDVAYRHGFRLILCNSDEDLAKEASYVDIAIRDRFAGVVIAAASTSESHLDRLIQAGVSVVAVDRRLADHNVDTVLVDSRRGAHDATQHLIEHGWRRIACIAGPSRISTANERLEGYRDALAAAGIRHDRTLVRRGDYRVAGGYKAARALLDSDHRPDAMFVANNLMTIGALQAIQELGISIPDQIGVVGFDDSPASDLIRPRLSVVSQPTYAIGRTAAELLISGSAADGPRDVVLPAELVVRDSSRRQ